MRQSGADRLSDESKHSPLEAPGDSGAILAARVSDYLSRRLPWRQAQGDRVLVRELDVAPFAEDAVADPLVHHFYGATANAYLTGRAVLAKIARALATGA